MKRRSSIKVDMISTQEIMKRLSVTPDGDVQREATKMGCDRLTRYIPFRSGVLSTDMKKIKSSTEIVMEGPYAHYQYEGKVWVDPHTGSTWVPHLGEKVRTERDIQYDKTRNPEADPHWDRRLVAADSAQMTADLQEYIDRRGKK